MILSGTDDCSLVICKNFAKKMEVFLMQKNKNLFLS